LKVLKTQKQSRLAKIGGKIINYALYNLPLQLFIHNLKRNLIIFALWGLLFGIVTENVASMLGVPSLFLDVEYRGEVNFWSFFLLGASVGIFIMSYHIICYILNAPHFSFLGYLSRPFTIFCVNNSTIPLLFMIVYWYSLWHFQHNQEDVSKAKVWQMALGFYAGTISAGGTLFLYFTITNLNIIKLLAKRIDKGLRKTTAVRMNLLKRTKDARSHTAHVDYYFTPFLQIKQVPIQSHLNNDTILKVFDQNHLNGVVIQFTILGLIMWVGTLRDSEVLQIPASASLVLLFTIMLMLAGAINYWFRGWAFTVALVLLFTLNILMKEQFLIAKYEAYGLNYKGKKADYSLMRVKELGKDEYFKEDKALTLMALENWKKKHEKLNPLQKPKMVFVCVSGGGQRAAVWTMRTMQVVDSILQGRLMQHTMLISGASGGLVGAAYFRELYLKQHQYLYDKSDTPINPYSTHYLDNLAKDNLNAITFSLVVNDLFFGFQTFQYAGQTYIKDRGYAFEQQLNKNTEGILDKPLCEYREPELLAQIPMLLLSPTIVNDGRKLFISAMPISYMTIPTLDRPRFLNQKTKGIEFSRFFADQKAENLRFLSALRMNATFPYITPNVKLPSQPAMEIMDAGLSDNFGVSDAARFIYVFRDWIQANTSGVVIVSIRDTQKDKPIESNLEPSLFQRLFSPISSLLVNLEYQQDINNDNMIEFAQSWFSPKFPIHRVEFQYIPFSKSMKEIEEKTLHPEKFKQDKFRIVKLERAALSWRLTAKEKSSLKRTIYELRNQFSIKQLEKLLIPKQTKPQTWK
jgi:hypothetical protein